MKVCFISNYINHHQLPLSNELYKEWGEDYSFIQTEEVEEERLKMGWGSDFGDIPYLKFYYKEPENCRRLIDECDIAIFDGLDDESYIQTRLKNGKIVLRTWERLYKQGQWKAVSPRGLIKKYHDHTRYSSAPVYLLCYGAYVADDFEIIRAYRGKRYKWGYFPAFVPYTDEEIKNNKEKDVPEVLWAGRLIGWKHTMDALKAAKENADRGNIFHMTVVGTGECEEELKSFVRENGLEETVTFTGPLPPDEVRRKMETADIYLFTSDYEEGWGAVVNESMNSACAVIASHAAGAVPFLIKDKENGLIYESGNVSQLSESLHTLLNDRETCRRLGHAAYTTIKDTWNAGVAAKRLISFCEGLMKNEISSPESGPLSEAKVIRQKKMYRVLKGEEGCP
ncbi:MAG: glycosyltransferase family 4 protein [Lachnospiraceae bacterium]|nr:glycosyltransferase family 4 protein [Lachnospiraceae bacterium]MBR3636399.1 glycosyltransferase family 4 protein [Lachnospiraceae bacterium]